jgi:hypothetical protein
MIFVMCGWRGVGLMEPSSSIVHSSHPWILYLLYSIDYRHMDALLLD